MRDHEFSRPREEFSPPRQEFSRPRAEFAPPKAEFSPAGQEQHAAREVTQQTSAPAEKKQRRISPLMATTAAVVTAAVVLTGAPAPVREGPTHQLSGEHRAYLEAVDAALLAQDSDALLDLALDGRLQSLFHQELRPFDESLAGTDAEDFAIYDLFINDYNEDIGQAHSSAFAYYGEGLIAVPYTQQDLDIGYFLEYQTDVDRTTGESRLYPRSVEFTRYEERDYQHRTEPFRSLSFHCYPNEDGTVDFWEMKDYLCQASNGESLYYSPPVEGTFMKYDGSWLDYAPVLMVTEGEFTQAIIPSDIIGDFESTVLHNGTVTLSRLVDGRWVEEYVMEVRDGAVVPQDGIYARRTSYVSDLFMLCALMDDGREFYITDYDFPSAESVMVHSVRIY